MSSHSSSWNSLLEFVEKKFKVAVVSNNKKDLNNLPMGFAWPDFIRFSKYLEKSIKSGPKKLLIENFVYHKNGEHCICIIHNKKEKYPVLSSTLIHEFGHCLMFNRYSQKTLDKMPILKKEKMAWDLGKKNIPKELFPPQEIFNDVKRRALKTYQKR